MNRLLQGDCLELLKDIPDGISEKTANNMARALEATQRNINDIANNFGWQTYTADLAKELAVQMVKANRNNYEKIGKMAVEIAKSVVENLKKREE